MEQEEKKQSKAFAWIVFVLIIAVAVFAYWYFSHGTQSLNEVESFEEYVRVFAPKERETVKSPLRISGEARGSWFFEGSFPIILKDAQGNVLKDGFATAQKDWMTHDFVPFVADLEFDNPESEIGELVFKKDNPSGLPEYDKSFSIPVSFSPETVDIKIFFGNINKDPNVLECGKTYFVTRTVPKVEGIARKAIEELLKGPTVEEHLNGFNTSIPNGVVIQNLSIQEGIARIDFNLAIEVGGSCRVSAIRSQIANTLRQFPSVSEVVISVNGNSAEALQP